MKGEGECRGQVKVVRAWARVMLRARVKESDVKVSATVIVTVSVKASAMLMLRARDKVSLHGDDK